MISDSSAKQTGHIPDRMLPAFWTLPQNSILSFNFQFLMVNNSPTHTSYTQEAG